MTFLEHLEELRRVIIESLIGLVVAALGGWFLSGPVLDFLIEFSMPEGVPVIFLGPAEAFTNRLKVALALGVAIALPYMAWRTWQFIMPGLLAGERRTLLPLSIASTLFFYLGVSFAFVVLIPIVIKILLTFGTGNLTPTIAVGALLAFVLKLCLACGLVFQMPLVIAVLTHLGVVTPEWLLSRWRYAVLIIFLLAAVMTPADGASQLILAVPVTGLYFFSVGVSRVIARRRREEQAEEEAAGGEDEADTDDTTDEESS